VFDEIKLRLLIIRKNWRSTVNIIKCPMCGKKVWYWWNWAGTQHGMSSDLCKRCRLKVPGSLVKALNDQFDYALMLSTGEVIRFTEARIEGEWVEIMGWGITGGEKPLAGNPFGFPFPRGLEINIKDIVWCADAPEGS
jgi:hypothetical protein